MTSNVRGSMSGVTADEAAGEAGLIATFYIPRAKKAVHIPPDEEPARLLQERFCRGLRLVKQAPDRWWSDLAGEEAFLVRIEPPAASPIAHDTTIIQLALNAPGGAKSAWDTAREKLEGSIRDAAALKGIWGYTLTYQADVNPKVSVSEAFEKLQPAVRRLYSPRKNLYPLAQADAGGGRMWLLHTADRGDGIAAATVYVALRTSEKTPEAERAFKKVFSGREAALFNPDLMAHKAYHQKRQYSGRKQQKYETDLEDFQKTTRQLLTDLKEPESVASDELLGNLTRNYGELIEMVWDLDNLRISMAQQSYNFVQQLNDYGRSPAAMKDNNILDYHRDRIKAANSELELMVTEGRHALEAANPVLRMAQLRTEKAQERNQLGIEALLAAVGMALALPHLLEPETTAALLTLWPIGIEELHDKQTGLLTESGHLTVLFAQSLIILTFVVAAYLVVKGSLRKPRGFQKRAQS